MEHLKILFLIIFFTCLPIGSHGGAQSKEYDGKVVSVHDGDTLTLLLTNKRTLKVRLAEIDAPEKGQPFGEKSKKLLSNLVFGRIVNIKETAIDRYGRTVGRVYTDKADVNLEMVKSGGAWAYMQYLHDNQIKVAEENARKFKIGLWSSHEDAIPPWVWRKQSKADAKTPKPINSYKEIETPLMSLTCAGKTRCKQMTSCEEAKFYLNNCGADKIDGDKDGNPCEALCH